MLKNSLEYFVLWIILLLLVKVNCQKARDRFRHATALTDNKLYILGGFPTGNEFIYLDFSVKFNTKNLLWHNLSSIYTVPTDYINNGAALAKGGANNNTLFLYGAMGKTASVYTFNPQSNTWITPAIASGINITRKFSMLGIMDYNGKMYIWGGLNFPGLNDLNDMLILDTINLSWGTGSSVGAPSARHYYGAILLPNRSIIYMGGINGFGSELSLSLNQVYIYDTMNDNWSTKATSGNIPSNRGGFSVILGLDGQRAILFGGTSPATTIFKPEESLYALNLINFEWYIPKVSGLIPGSRHYHKANVIEKFMAISFGLIYDQLKESDVLLLDISNNEEYIWTNDFIPSPSSSLSPSPSSPSPTQSTSPSTSATSPQQSDKLSLSIANAAGAIVGSLFGGILIAFGCFFLYKWNKNRQNQKNTILIPGNENREGRFNTERNDYNQRQENINHGREILQMPRNESTIIPIPVINNSYNHGQEAIPITNNERLSAQNIDVLKNEIKQDIIREMLQNLQNNNAQASSSNNSDK